VGKKGWLDMQQPIRSDMESSNKGSDSIKGDVEFMDVEIDPSKIVVSVIYKNDL